MIQNESDNRITKDKNILVVLVGNGAINAELNYLIENFCGNVVYDFSEIPSISDGKRVYVCGDLSNIEYNNSPILIIREVSNNYDNFNNENAQIIELGQVPIIISKAGVYYRKLFNEDNYFKKIKSEHSFQELTESNKESKSLRKGIYLSEVLKEESEDKTEMLSFRLLRCSSNLTGPTDNFRNTDHHIVNLLNDSVKYTFENETKLNHVLAQIYENKKSENQKEVKSKIKAHSDKTKDMPKEGLIAFCTFYDTSNIENLTVSNTDKYDLCYKQTSALTRLHFKLKNTVDDDSLEKEFSVTLYPNSVFIIPLSTNRLYTHEIRPSVLNIDRIPVRLGYVVRCSNLEALYINEKTYIKQDTKIVPLEKMTSEMLVDLRNSYYEENISEKVVEYGKVHFSMNLGDYEKPIY